MNKEIMPKESSKDFPNKSFEEALHYLIRFDPRSVLKLIVLETINPNFDMVVSTTNPNQDHRFNFNTIDNNYSFYNKKFDQERIVPKGSILEMTKEIIKNYEHLDGHERHLERCQPQIFDNINSNNLFQTIKGRGLQVRRMIDFNNPSKENKKLVKQLKKSNLEATFTIMFNQIANFRADALLLGLYAAGLNSKEISSSNEEIIISYPKNTSRVEEIKTNRQFATRFLKFIEDTFIAQDGMI